MDSEIYRICKMPEIKQSKLMETTFSTAAELQIPSTWQRKGVILQKFQDHNTDRKKHHASLPFLEMAWTCY